VDGAGEGRRAAGYVRVSQERAARNGYGLEAQETDIRRHVDYKDLAPAGVYREEGVSGYERARPALDRLLADARVGLFDVAIFPSIDRAGRSVKDVIEIDGALREAGVTVVFLREGIDTSTPTGEFFRNVMASLAQLEGRIIHERLSKGRRRKAAEGGYVGGWLPYGYGYASGRVVVVSNEAKVVRRIFERRAAGESYAAISERLNEENVPTRRGGRWHVSTVQRVVKNRFYTGRVEFEGDSVAGRHEAIVPDALFQKCNPQRRRNGS